MEAYAAWVRENAAMAKQMEMMASMGTMMAPKGEQYADVLQELGVGAVGMLGLVNDTIIHGKTKNAGELYFHADQRDVQPQVTLARALLTLLAYSETVLEVGMRKWRGTEATTGLVTRIELVKAACRFFLLFRFPAQCLVAGGKYESHQPPATGPEGEQQVAAAPVAQAAVEPGSVWRGRRSGVALPVPVGVEARHLAANQRVVPPVDSTFLVASEALHIVRPLVTVFAPRTRFWTVLSLVMDLTSMRLLYLSKASADEFRRRCFLLVFYLFRSPVYEAGLGAFVASLRGEGDAAPSNMAMIGHFVAAQIELYHNNHFYSAAS